MPSAPLPPSPDRAPTGAARVYAGALASFGGHQIEAVQRAGDPGAPAVALYASPPYDVRVPAMAASRLSINLTAARVSGGLDGERPRVYLAQRHSVFLAPAGAASHWRKDAPSRHINIYFDAHAFGDPAPLFNGRLAGATTLFQLLADELSGADAFAAEAADSLARLILVRLARRAAGLRARAQPLTPERLARVVDYVVAHLDRRILVADLARAAGLGANRFAQAFASATGLSPHQYVIGRRLQRAEQLLRHSAMPIAEVAASAGFASQQHMTQAMQRRLGRTPARLRGDPQAPSESPCTSRCSQALKTT